jgi:hypothetical protein
LITPSLFGSPGRARTADLVINSPTLGGVTRRKLRGFVCGGTDTENYPEPAPNTPD